MKAEINKNQLAETNLMLRGVKTNAPKIISRSINKTISKGRTLAAKKINKQTALKSKYIKSKLKDQKANFKNLKGRLFADKRGLLMINFVTGLDENGDFLVKIKSRGKSKVLTNAFLTTINAGGKKVDAIATRHPRTDKFKVLHGPSVSQIFADVRDEVDSELVEYYAVVTEKQIAAVLRGF